MSIVQVKRQDGTIGDLVTCDVCEARMFNEALDWGQWDWSWQKLLVDVGDQYVEKHLCAKCRPKVIWCESCQTFHYRDGTHKQVCERCGRVFTAFVRYSGRVCANCSDQEETTVKWWLESMSRRPGPRK